MGPCGTKQRSTSFPTVVSSSYGALAWGNSGEVGSALCRGSGICQASSQPPPVHVSTSVLTVNWPSVLLEEV